MMYRHSRDASVLFKHSNGLHSALDSLERRTAIKIVLIYRLSRSSDKCDIDVNRDPECNGVWHPSWSNASRIIESRIRRTSSSIIPVIGNEGERDREQIEIIEIALRLYSLYPFHPGISRFGTLIRYRKWDYISHASVLFFRRESRWDQAFLSSPHLLFLLLLFLLSREPRESGDV